MTGNSKLKLLYILDIMRKTDEEHPLNTTQIVKHLKRYGIEAERKSVSRDLKCLEEAGYSLVRCEDHNKGYYMTDHLFEDYELKILVDSICGAKYLTEKESYKFIKKLKGIATIEGEEIIEQTTYLDGEIKTDDPKNGIKIDAIVRTLKDKKKIRFQYFELGKHNVRNLKRNGYWYTVSPYYLVLYHDEYYLLANPDTHTHLTHFRVDMMTNVEKMTEEVRKPSEVTELADYNSKFDVAKYLRQRVNLWSGEIAEVTLQCNEQVRRDILMKFGKHTWMSEPEEGSFRVRITVSIGEGFYRFLAGYGNKVKVLSPQSVKDGYLDYLKKMIEIYEE